MVETNSWFFRRNEMSPKPKRAPLPNYLFGYIQNQIILLLISVFLQWLIVKEHHHYQKGNEALGDLHAPRVGVGGTESPAKDDIVKA
jgi:hypothetical protein